MTLRGVGLMWAVLVVGAATALFLVKYEVIALEDELARLEREMARERTTIHVLRAEWSYLNEPGRLGLLTRKHLGLMPMPADAVVALDALPFRPAPARAGEAAPMRPLVLPPRVLNPGRADAIPLPGRKPSALARMEAPS